MSDPNYSEPAHPHREPRFLGLLERGDEFAHLGVSALLLLTALGVLIASSIHFASEFSTGPDASKSFAEYALGYLSDLLFAVILLELLSTLLTYIKSKNLEATIKDFLIVGIISSIRKILLVGAHSSLVQGSTDEFVKEAVGTTLTIIGILLLIAGLIVLERRRIGKSTSAEETPA